MGVNLDKMKKKRAESQRSGEFWKIEQGEHRVYVHPPCREDDKHEPTAGLPYIEVVVHYQVGKDNSMVICLDPEKNPILEHPFLKELLKKRKIKLTDRCPVCDGIEDMDEVKADDCRPQTRWLWGLTPMFSRRDSQDDWRELSPRPAISLVGVTIFDGIMGVFGELGNITDFNGAMFPVIERKGQGKRGTKYKIKADIETARSPMKLGKATRRVILKALEKAGDCDLFKVVSNLCRSPGAVEAILSGVSVERDEEPAGDGVRPCFGIDYADDDECSECPDVEKCKEAMKGIKEKDEEPEGEEGDDPDEYEEPEGEEGDDDDYAEGDDDDEYADDDDYAEPEGDDDDDDYGEAEPEEEPEDDPEPEPEEEPEDDGLEELEQELAAASKRKRGGSKTTVSAKTTSKKSSKSKAASSKKTETPPAAGKKTRSKKSSKSKAADPKTAAASKPASSSKKSSKSKKRVSKRAK